jgi:hypothetical protein
LLEAELGLYAAHCPRLVWKHQAEYHTPLARTSGASRPVKVGLGVFGHVVVDDCRHALHVDAAGRDVARDQSFDLALCEVREGSGALVLAPASMDRGGFDTGLFELPGESFGPKPGATEDDGGPNGADRGSGDRVAIDSGDVPEHVTGRGDVRRFLTHLVTDGVAQVIAYELGHVAIESCRVQHDQIGRAHV